MHGPAHGTGDPTMVGGRKRHAFFQYGTIEIGVGSGAVMNRYLIQRDLHFFGHQGGQRGMHALPHFCTRRDDGDARRVNHHIGG